MELTTAFMACVFVLFVFLLGYRTGWQARCELIRIHVEVERYDDFPEDGESSFDEQIRRHANDEFDEDEEKPKGKRG